jgi:hypothetical protein
MLNGVSASDAVEAMWLSMGVRLSRSPPRGNRNGMDLGEEVADGDGFIAMGAWSSGSKSTSENAAVVAALLTKETWHHTRGTGRRWPSLEGGWQSRAGALRSVAVGGGSHAGGKRLSNRPCGLDR